ncbi:protein misato homolog 1-like isoform X1 [Glycine soja]|uniref:Protein misato-like 1 isoform A n=1 Tax=Glycine soja TaxID=3848 RepID=A0A445M4Y9_GLYSO|nr:protein misato homolog 1-like isoform X1 [Glycine soja]RZC30608.1 Protein misato-like 1 isoform A [Glycine soja]
MKEIVTVQVGDFANFVGSHFWNFQDELLGLAGNPSADSVFKNQDLNMDVLYRTGETQQGIPSYTPRLLSINIRGSLGSMSSRGTLYTEVASTTPDVVTWTGRVSTQASEPYKRNLFLQRLYEEEESLNMINEIRGSNNGSQSEYEDKDITECLENGVQFWTDYSKVHYHPRSLYELNGVWAHVEEFDNYGIGRDSFAWAAQGEEIGDRLRFFVEECDHIQGFQFVVDDSGGFSAVASEFLENIVDEYTNIPVLLYAVQGSGSRTNLQSRKRAVLEDLHDAVSFSRLSSYCKLIVPVGLPSLSKSKASRFLHIEDAKHYHSSAVYAAALHSISLPFRMVPVGPTADACSVSGAVDVHGVVQMLSGQGRQNMVSVLDVAMPAPALTGEQNELSLLEILQPLTPQIAEDVEDMQAIEHMTVHGALASEGHRASVGEVKDTVDAAFRCANTRPMFCHLSVALSPLPIPLPFPSIFGNNVGQHGELMSGQITNSSPKGSLDIHSIPMAARLRSSSIVLPLLESKLRNLHQFGIQRGAAGAELLRSWGFGQEELVEMEEMLSKMVAALHPPQLSSDSD